MVRDEILYFEGSNKKYISLLKSFSCRCSQAAAVMTQLVLVSQDEIDINPLFDVSLNHAICL